MPKYKAGKQTQPVELDLMKEVLGSNRFKKANHRSYLAFVYLTGCRRAEALSRTREDFDTEDPSILMFRIPALKHGLREVLELSKDMPFMDIILAQIDRTKPGRKIWEFDERTALRIVKRAMGEKYYTHFFRLNRTVHFLDDPTTTDPEMMSWFGWRKRETINSYMGFSKRHLDRQALRLKTSI